MGLFFSEVCVCLSVSFDFVSFSVVLVKLSVRFGFIALIEISMYLFQ